MGKPTDDSCWRFSYRDHQEDRARSGGYMLQAEEAEGLGAGQIIETEMAELAKLKNFRIKQARWSNGDPKNVFTDHDAAFVANAVKAWIDSGKVNMDVEIIQLTSGGSFDGY